MGFPGGSAGKESVCSLIPGLGRSPKEGKDYPSQYSGLENSMDCIVHGVAKSWARLSDFHFHFILLENRYMVLGVRVWDLKLQIAWIRTSVLLLSCVILGRLSSLTLGFLSIK